MKHSELEIENLKMKALIKVGYRPEDFVEEKPKSFFHNLIHGQNVSCWVHSLWEK